MTGRSKEVINRGGEIISPVEIEAALASHPAVASVLAFATPHALLQESHMSQVASRESQVTSYESQVTSYKFHATSYALQETVGALLVLRGGFPRPSLRALQERAA